MTCTIVTGTYSKPKLLAEAAQSVFAQTYRDWIWRIVLDGANAETMETALAIQDESDGRVKIEHACVSEEYRRSIYRPAVITNEQFAAAKTQWCVWLSDDDILHPNFLAELCIGDASYCAVERLRWENNGWKWYATNRAQSPWIYGCSDGGAMVCRADVFRQIEPLPTGWNTAPYVDQILMQRINEVAPLRAVDKVLLTHRTVKESTHGA